MTAQFLRDTAATALILGFFASSWFGWAQDQPPITWRKALAAGSIVSLLIAVAGGIYTWQHWQDGTVFDADTGRVFGIIVGVEFALAAVGGGLLTMRGRTDIIPAWVALVVGVHLFPVARLVGFPLIKSRRCPGDGGGCGRRAAGQVSRLGCQRRHRRRRGSDPSSCGGVLARRCRPLVMM